VYTVSTAKGKKRKEKENTMNSQTHTATQLSYIQKSIRVCLDTKAILLETITFLLDSASEWEARYNRYIQRGYTWLEDEDILSLCIANYMDAMLKIDGLIEQVIQVDERLADHVAWYYLRVNKPQIPVS
jgi:hypothetical protein